MKIRKFQGINNIQDPRSLKPGELVVASNVEIDEMGVLSRRHDFTQINSMASHSIFNTADGGMCFFRSGSNLLRLYPDMSPIVVASGFTPGAKTYFAAVGETVYFSDNQRTGVYAYGAVTPWGVELPAHNPQAQASAGLMPAGTYLFTTTFITADGDESGSIPASGVTITDNGAIIFTALPQPVDPSVASIAVYLTQPNSEVFYRALLVPTGTTTATISSLAGYGMALTTFQKSPPPPGKYIGVNFGQAFVAVDQFLFYSVPFKPHLFDIYRQAIAFPAPITNTAAVSGGLWVTTTAAIYFLPGGSIEDAELRKVAPFGAYPDSIGSLPRGVRTPNQDAAPSVNASDLLYVATTDGIYSLSQDGSATGVTSGKYLTQPVATSGGMFQHDNFNQYMLFTK